MPWHGKSVAEIPRAMPEHSASMARLLILAKRIKLLCGSYSGLGSFVKLAINAETGVKILGHMYLLFVLDSVPSILYAS